MYLKFAVICISSLRLLHMYLSLSQFNSSGKVVRAVIHRCDHARVQLGLAFARCEWNPCGLIEWRVDPVLVDEASQIALSRLPDDILTVSSPMLLPQLNPCGSASHTVTFP